MPTGHLLVHFCGVPARIEFGIEFVPKLYDLSGQGFALICVQGCACMKVCVKDMPVQ